MGQSKKLNKQPRSLSPLVLLSGISKSFDGKEVISQLDLTINNGEFLTLLGPSGCGKTTVLRLIAGLETVDAGHIMLDNQDITHVPAENRYVNTVFQSYALFPHMTVFENVAFGLRMQKTPAAEIAPRVTDALRMVQLEEFAQRKPHQLSGGQQQRVSIARALMNGGQVILADEPTGALDSHSGEEVMAILRQLRDRGHTVIIVTHDPLIAAQAERIIEIHDGKIVHNPPAQEKKREQGVDAAVVNTAPGWRQFASSFREALSMAWLAMAANKMRTLLTMLGIIIGIASVVSIVVVGDAAKQMVLADIRAMGTNTIDIHPGKDFGDDNPQYRQALKYDDLVAIQKQPWVNSATPSVSKSLRLRYGNIDIAVNANGVSGDYFNVYGMSFREGNTFNAVQQQDRAQVVVLDANTRRQLFPNKANVVGEVVLVGNMPVIVIGVAEEKPSMYGNSNLLQVWLPYSTMSDRIMGQSWLNSITVRVKDGVDSDQAEQQLTRLLTLRHGKKDFFTWNMDSVLKTAEKTTYTLQLFLTLVAVISWLSAASAL